MNINLGTPDRGDALIVIGGGPAGLTAAYEFQRLAPGQTARVFEADQRVGGIARTETHKGFRFDIGGHRFFTKVPEVEALWHEIAGAEFITVLRSSRIFYRGKFYDYPLRLLNALGNLGPVEAVRILLSYAATFFRRGRVDASFEDWVTNRFGRRLYDHFFKTYTQKVWGIDPKYIQADWAAQRIKNLSLSKAVWNAISGANDTASLIEEFQYPRLGPGQMWELAAEHIAAQGGRVETRSWVETVRHRGGRVTEIVVKSAVGMRRLVQVPKVINTMALADLVQAMDPAPPPAVSEAAAQLRYRDFLIVTLILDAPDPFPDNWIYVHAADVKVGRIQNFRAWSPDMVPNDRQASIGMEYFCQAGDGLWTMSDADLQALATEELARLGLARREDVVDAAIIRQPKAYPVYDAGYQEAVSTIAAWIDTFENLQSVGRNGQHRYNNQDHSMLTAMLAARNVLGEKHDVWAVNVERSYHEEFERPRPDSPAPAARKTFHRIDA